MENSLGRGSIEKKLACGQGESLLGGLALALTISKRALRTLAYIQYLQWNPQTLISYFRFQGFEKVFRVSLYSWEVLSQETGFLISASRWLLLSFTLRVSKKKKCSTCIICHMKNYIYLYTSQIFVIPSLTHTHTSEVMTHHCFKMRVIIKKIFQTYGSSTLLKKLIYSR